MAASRLGVAEITDANADRSALDGGKKAGDKVARHYAA
jgi:hypothetical protein